MVTAPASSRSVPPIPAAQSSVPVAVSVPVPSVWPQIVRLLPGVTSTFCVLSVQPSQRIRFTSPLTVTTLSMLTLPPAAYQPVRRAVVTSSSGV